MSQVLAARLPDALIKVVKQFFWRSALQPMTFFLRQKKRLTARSKGLLRMENLNWLSWISADTGRRVSFAQTWLKNLLIGFLFLARFQ